MSSQMNIASGGNKQHLRVHVVPSYLASEILGRRYGNIDI